MTGVTLFDLGQLGRARELVGRHVPMTPTYAWPLLEREVGTPVWVKHENHTPTGAFKVRGGLVYLDRLVRERPEVPGIVSATRGNHGQSLAYAGRAAGVPVTIVVPHGNSPAKNAAMEGFGAQLVVHGRDFQEAREHASELADERDLVPVPSFQPDLVLGVATYAAELFEQAGPLHVVYVPVGMGSGMCGLVTVRDLLGLDTEIVGVVSAQAPATALSVAAGHVVTTESAETFVDGVACRVPDAEAIDLIATGGSRVVTVSEDAAAAAMRLLFETTRQFPEPAGALALAGLLAEREAVAGRRTAVVMTGGNVDADIARTVLAGGTPRP